MRSEITEIKRISDELKRAKDAAEAAEKGRELACPINPDVLAPMIGDAVCLKQFLMNS